MNVRLTDNCRKILVSSLITAGILGSVATDPGHAYNFSKTGFSTDAGAAEIDYALDAMTANSDGLPNSGPVTELTITTDSAKLVAQNPSLKYSTQDLQCTPEGNECRFRNKPPEVILDLSLIAGSFSGATAKQLADNLLDIKYVFDFSTLQDPNKATSEPGGSLEVFFSKPNGFDSQIFSFGQLSSKSPTLGFFEDEITFDPFDVMGVPEPSATVGFILLGVVYGIRSRIKRIQ
ncbi:MAG: hypothetical protein AAFW84_03605 [Cyanobacteria bacterium J06635_15]